MKRVILVLSLVFTLCAIACAEDAYTYPTAFSCVIEEEMIKEGIAKEKRSFEYYQLGNMYRYDAFGIAYILDDAGKMLYNLYISIDVYTESKTSLSAKDVLNHFEIDFLNPSYNEVEDTGKREVINGYECKVVKVIDQGDKTTKLIWQAPALGDMGLKYEVSNSDSKTIKIVRELNIDFSDQCLTCQKTGRRMK
ncbi:MAG TPA: hypothetical protein GXZ26_10945 [Firmicutes bacterium]|nr:hypothetical protein [Bacillota bacterium]